MLQKVLIQVLIQSLSLQEDLKGHEEESQETRIEMWVLGLACLWWAQMPRGRNDYPVC